MAETPRIERADDNRYVISGELSMQTVPGLAQAASPLLAQASGDLVIDLAGVVRADSAALALLVDLQRQARQRQLGIRFNHLPAQLDQILRLSELHQILPI